VDIKQMKDIRDIRIYRSLPREESVNRYLRQVGNPYMVRVGNIKVKIRFANDGTSFEDAFEQMLSGCYLPAIYHAFEQMLLNA